jgi:hypothetical protein
MVGGWVLLRIKNACDPAVAASPPEIKKPQSSHERSDVSVIACVEAGAQTRVVWRDALRALRAAARLWCSAAVAMGTVCRSHH